MQIWILDSGYTGYFDTTLVDMSAERYVTDLIRLHEAVVRCREMGSASGHGGCSILQEMVQRRGKDECMNHEPLLPLYGGR